MYGSMTPSSRDSGATDSATAASSRRGASTIGRSRPVSSASASGESSTSARAASTEPAISANGLSSRCLRARSAETARSSSARQARWKPPRPFTARIDPPRSAAPAAATASGALGVGLVGVGQPRHRAAVGARVRLRVEAAIGRILVLRPAERAHLEPGHRGRAPVVGHAAHDREARAAVGAVHERVAVAPVGRVEQLPQAVLAGGRVGRDRRLGLAVALAGDDPKAVLPGGLHVPCVDPLHRRQRRRLGGEPVEEPGHRALLTLDLQQHTVLVVEHPPADLGLLRQAEDVRAKAHALHRPLHPRPDAASRHGSSCAGGCASRTARGRRAGGRRRAQRAPPGATPWPA